MEEKYDVEAAPSGAEARWIIHPGCLAGDPSHIAAAMVLDPSVHVAVVTHPSLVGASSFGEVLAKGGEILSAKREQCLGMERGLDGEREDLARFPESNKALRGKITDYGNQISRIAKKQGIDERLALEQPDILAEKGLFDPKRVADFKEARALLARREVLAERQQAVEALQVEVLYIRETLGLVEQLQASHITPSRCQLVPHNSYKSNPHEAALESARDANVPANGIVGFTEASTSIIARELARDPAAAIGTLRNRWIPHGNEAQCARVADVLDAHLPKEEHAQAVLVLTRAADYNFQHNTTVGRFLQVVRQTEEYNAAHPDAPLCIVPLGSTLVRDSHNNTGQIGSEGARVSIDEVRSEHNISLALVRSPLNIFRELGDIDPRSPGMLDNRSLLGEFWRQAAIHPHVAGVIGGRSGSLDMPAFMGMGANKVLSWDTAPESQPEHATHYLRMGLTHKVLSIVHLDREGHLDPRVLGAFIEGAPTGELVGALMQHARVENGFVRNGRGLDNLPVNPLNRRPLLLVSDEEAAGIFYGGRYESARQPMPPLPAELVQQLQVSGAAVARDDGRPVSPPSSPSSIQKQAGVFHS